jgi:hypothetical protein
MSEIPAALLAALMPGLRGPLTVMSEIPAALLAALMPSDARSLSRAKFPPLC